MAGELSVRSEDVNSLVRQWLLPQRGGLERLLPSDVDADTFLGCAAAAMYKNPKLAEVAMRDPASLLVALREAARLGHMPGTDRYALTVRGRAVLGIEQYQGVIARMFNAGAVQAVHAEVICQGEEFERRDPLPPRHVMPIDRDLSVNNLVGAYAYAILDNGQCSKIVVMGRTEIMKHREAAATHMVWDGPFGHSMWIKTPCHELEKWVPVSAEYRRAQAARDAAAVTALSGPLPPAQPSGVLPDALGSADAAEAVTDAEAAEAE